MRILITYHNFVRDFRGSLLLAKVLRSKGHKAYVWPHWNRDTYYAEIFNADVIVVPQVSEHSVAYIADFCKQTGRLLVINSSEQFTSNERANIFLRYDCNRWNCEVAALQNIACKPVWDAMLNNNEIQSKSIYKYIGLPRFDIALNSQLRRAESSYLRRKYGVKHKTGKFILYLSSFLFAETFVGVPPEDMDAYDYRSLISKNELLWAETHSILREYISNHLSGGDRLFVKKHPWDISSKIEDSLAGLPVIFLDPREYVVPCMDIADIVLHSFSTSAIEAWAMHKHTVSIGRREDYDSYGLPHLDVELFAESAEHLHDAINADHDSERQVFLADYLGDWLDGKSTLRMANEIIRLRSEFSKSKSPQSKVFSRSQVKARLAHSGLLNMPRPGQSDSKIVFLHSCESSRRSLINLYRPIMADYVRSYQEDGY